ncbi:hypothetical protein Geob_3324 [Geotalea daltonii FRC-32]|uniref:Uncharacterized protein n=1 Tax=Geotalea daltonii (strain DSM 22248 / JCM 15807 / FRC-32) TaxID=316067 RepID=B9M4Y3_GEODF|nr:hypothetical protein [Geotalea daltonii]ACM21667.1 hypothetical protein Geob_3324 [Geotalea daltonii FRC-32]
MSDLSKVDDTAAWGNVSSVYFWNSVILKLTEVSTFTINDALACAHNFMNNKGGKRLVP